METLIQTETNKMFAEPAEQTGKQRVKWKQLFDSNKQIIKEMVKQYRDARGRIDYSTAFTQHPEWKTALKQDNSVAKQRLYLYANTLLKGASSARSAKKHGAGRLARKPIRRSTRRLVKRIIKQPAVQQSVAVNTVNYCPGCGFHIGGLQK